MKKITYMIVLLTLLVLPEVHSQQEKFIIGAYMHSTPFNNPPVNQPDSALFSLWRAEAMGINTAMIRLRLPHTDPDINYQGPEPGELLSNMEAARGFDNVIGMNQKSSIGVADGTVTNDYIRNFDWIFFYSGAYYSKWDATIESLSAGTLGLKHDFGQKVTVNGIDYWSSGTNPPEGEPLLVRGPNYNQETRYRSSTQKTGFSDIQEYKTFFNLKLALVPPPETLDDPICEILVKVTYTENCIWDTLYTEIKASRVLTVGDIGNFNTQTLTYNFSDYCPNNGGWDKEMQNINCDCPGKYLDNVEFQVKYLGSRELLINYVEVYDQGIWGERLIDEGGRNVARLKIEDYLQRFQAANPEFYSNNLKYFFGIDEPHSVDSYVPLAFVESVLDSLNNALPEGAPSGSSGIKASGRVRNFQIYHSTFNGFSNSGILILSNLATLPKVKWCTFSSSGTGVSATACSSIVVQNNTFSNNTYDVRLYQVGEAQVISNQMTSNTQNGQGIFFSGTNGYIRQNQISGHLYGIYLANSSPGIGANTVTNNVKNGIYIGTGSQPDLRGYLVRIPCHNPPLYYALTGYNEIYSNGISVPYDGSEIRLSSARLLMDTPCNNVYDNRTGLPQSLVKNLISGSLPPGGSVTLQIPYQGWGDNPEYELSDRFGSLNVNYDPNYSICPQIDNPIDCAFIVYAADRSVIDTLYPIGEAAVEQDALDMQLKAADSSFNAGDYTTAEVLYKNAVDTYPTEPEAVEGYTQLYTIKKITDSTGANFTDLNNLLQTKLPLITDSLVLKVVTQLSDLCLVGNQQYLPAINSFDEIAQQNPETEEGLFAEIDALTTAIISFNEGGGGLQKGLPGKYVANSQGELVDRLNNLMKTNFEGESKKVNIIPTEYSLYNNYPNPFNPTTIIRFDIPERTNVELIVFDILGRRVKSLVNNELRNPGRYEVSFDAGSLASGVYIYKLTTQNYSQARKMLLVK